MAKRLKSTAHDAPPRPFRHLYRQFSELDRKARHRVHELRRSMSGMTRTQIWAEVQSILGTIKARNYDHINKAYQP